MYPPANILSSRKKPVRRSVLTATSPALATSAAVRVPSSGPGIRDSSGGWRGERPHVNQITYLGAANLHFGASLRGLFEAPVPSIRLQRGLFWSASMGTHDSLRCSARRFPYGRWIATY